MNLNEFIAAFAAEFDETPESMFAPNTIFKDLVEWDSLASLSIIAMVDETLEKRITGSELRSCNTIEELYNQIMQK
jgi:acyl carrier protein